MSTNPQALWGIGTGKALLAGRAANEAIAFTADDVHAGLAGLGMTPGIGIIFDGADVAFYVFEGRLYDASMSVAAMPPVLGQIVRAGSAIVDSGKAVTLAVKGKRTLTLVEVPESAVYKVGDILPDGRVAGHGSGTPLRGQGPDVTGAGNAHGNSVKNQSPTEYYRLEDSQGKTYDGVGAVGRNRPEESIRTLEKRFPGENFEIQTRVTYPTREEALRVEDLAIQRAGGPQGKMPDGTNYNRINSPGRKLNSGRK